MKASLNLHTVFLLAIFLKPQVSAVYEELFDRRTCPRQACLMKHGAKSQSDVLLNPVSWGKVPPWP